MLTWVVAPTSREIRETKPPLNFTKAAFSYIFTRLSSFLDNYGVKQFMCCYIKYSKLS